MFALILCAVAFLATFWCGKKSLGFGVLAVLTVGYAYGITRANVTSTGSHFLFDASLVGFYLSQNWSSIISDSKANASLQSWTWLLIAWPCLLSLVPFQNLLVTLVGLRGHILFLPMMLFGSRLKRADLQMLAKGLAVLNILALAFGLVEYFLGVELFFPRNEVTTIIYNSNDLSGGTLRIPSLFVNAHCYAGAMVMTIPLLFAAWVQKSQTALIRQLCLIGLAAGLVGVLLSATRVNFLVAAGVVIIATVASDFSPAKRIVWVSSIGVLILVALGSDRLQRFTTLSDTTAVNTRIYGSVNSGFWDILNNYPLGNGLGGGGTSMPYFLQNQVKSPVLMENDYARVLAEQGIVGLLIWISFLVWFIFNRHAFKKHHWRNARILAWSACILYFGTALIGVGLLTAIPQCVMILLFVGWTSTNQLSETPEVSVSSIIAVPVRRSLTSTFRY